MPGRLVTLLLLIVGFGALAAWVSAPVLFREKTPVLTDFLEALHAQSRELEPEGRLPVTLPTLRAGESIVLAMGPSGGPSGTTLRPNGGSLSRRALAAVRDDLAVASADLTFVYRLVNGEVRSSERISRCNLSIPGNNLLVITPDTKAASIECGPVSAWEPGQCRDFAGLWNERCAPRLVLD